MQAAPATTVSSRAAADGLWPPLQPHLPAPCRVLSVGMRHGELWRGLSDAGFTVTGITTDAALLADLQAESPPNADLRLTRLADLPPLEEPCALLLHDSVEPVEPLALFEAADRLMVRESAQLLWLETPTPQREHGAATERPLHTDVVALARRCGWRVESAEPLGDLRLLCLRRPAPPALRLVSIGPAWSDAVRAMFPDRFGHALSAEEWHWKYGDGRGRAVGLLKGDRLVAHYGGLTRRVLLRGEAALACQVGDVMVAPEVNAGLARNSALHQVSATFLESQIGFGRPHALGFGFPNARAMRLAQRLGLYAAVDAVQALSWAALPEDEVGTDAALAVEALDAAALREDSAAGRALAVLWTEMAAGCADAVLGIRDLPWLRYRYGQRPQVPYLLQLCRSPADGQPLGLVVLRLLPQALELIDLVGPPQHFAALVRQARRAARALARPQLEAWVTLSHAAWLNEAADPATVHAIDVTVPANVHTPGVDPAQLRGRWFLMGGDTDFR